MPGGASARRLTAFARFHDAKVSELKAAGRLRISTNESVERWRALSEAERRVFEAEAAAEQEAYLQECTQRFLDTDAEAGEDEDADDVEDDHGDDANEGAGDAEDGEGSSADGAIGFPVARIKRIAQASGNNEYAIGREATFLVAKAAEIFLERCVWGAARVLGQTSRKTLMAADVVSALRMHPIPESMQFFTEELGPEPPKPPPPPPKKVAAAKRKLADAAKPAKQRKT